MLAVMKKELKSYLLSPIGYIFIGLFLLIFSIFFVIDIFGNRIVNFEYLFYNGTTILTFITPVLTMRMFAEEKKSNTDQLLFTSPRSLTSIVIGKFLAAALVILITEIFTMIYFVILSFFGKPSILVALTTLLGFLLLALAYISAGMFISSITENQIIACVVTIGVFIAMWFLPSINEIFSIISLMAMFDRFPAGVISFYEVFTLVSFSILFILLTIISLQRRKSLK